MKTFVISMTNSTLEITKIVLIVDNSGGHSFSKEKLYDVGIIRAFKAHYKQKLVNLLVKHIEETNQLNMPNVKDVKLYEIGNKE